MNEKYSIENNKLIIKRPSLIKNISYKLIYIFPFLIVFFINVYFKFFNLAFDIFSISILFYAIFISSIVKPSIFKDITIVKFDGKIIINSKIVPLDSILFLSFREADDFRYVKLESRRKKILIANEILLNNECRSFEEALEFCRMIRDFIGEGIVINYISMGWSNDDNLIYSNLSGTEASKNEQLENWNYIE